MAVVLDALASYIQNMLLEMAKEEVHLLFGVPDEIKKMDSKLGDIKRFLTDADKRNISDESVQSWVKELRNAMYDATNILDLCQLKAMEHGPIWDMGCFNPSLFCMRNPLHAYDIGNRIKNLNERLDDIEKRSKAFNFINLASYVDGGTRKTESSHCSRRETTGADELCVVGEKIEEDTRNLVELLTRKEKTIHEHSKILVFAIVGVGGIGKTTLAKKIFNNDIINDEFDKRIWLSVNQEFSDINLLERAITEAQGNNQAARNTKAALERTLRQALEGCKTLLVMDDVWNHEVWEKVLEAPLINSVAGGSRVLVTTRHDTVARGMMAEEPYHHVTKLEPEDAWSLLKKQVVRNGNNDEPKIDTLMDIGMGIVAQCDGLPLAVKVMGGLLRQKKTRRNDWENVLKDSIRSVQMSEELNNVVYLSYQDLHPDLKPCFLHYALLPKSTVFWETLVVAMWISEGFVHGNSDDLEVLGKEYYDQLIARNLIEPDQRYMDQAVCSMHDVVRSFAQYVARDEALTISHKGEAGLADRLSSRNVIRLSIETKGSDSNELGWNSLQAHTSLRTLILVGQIQINPCDSLLSFPCLRTLHIEDGNFDALCESLVKLKHLRYLSIGGTDTSRLPEKISKMKLLQCIRLHYCKNLVKLPCGIGRLQQLRVLTLNGTGINTVPKGFAGLTNLRKLYGFPAYVDGYSCSLEELGPLSHLIELSISCLKRVSSPSFATKARLGEKVRLSYLSLNCRTERGDDHWLVEEEEQQQIEKVFDELSPSPCLEHLVIKGYFGQRLPKWMTSTAAAPAPPLGSSRILMIKNLPYCPELSDGLCQLPNLELLQLESALAIKRVGLLPDHPEHPSAVENLVSVSKIVVIGCRGLERISHLPKLQDLEIRSCSNLEALEGLPTLQRLWIEDHEMETLPGYLQNVNPRLLDLECNVLLLASIAKGKSSTEWDKFSHIKQVKAYADDDDNSIQRKWYVKYTRDPFCFKTNITPSVDASGDETEVLLDKVEEVSRQVSQQERE